MRRGLEVGWEFDAWAIEYTQKIFSGIPGWPSTPGTTDWSVYFEGWIAAFVEKGVTLDEAKYAQAKVQAMGRLWHNQHLPALLEAIDELRVAEAKAGSSATSGPDAAREASRNCPECAGGGWATRKQRIPGRPETTFSLHCRCPWGRWLRDKYRAGNDLALSRIADLQAHPELWEPGLHYSAWPRQPERSDGGTIPHAACPPRAQQGVATSWRDILGAGKELAKSIDASRRPDNDDETRKRLKAMADLEAHQRAKRAAMMPPPAKADYEDEIDFDNL